jgi:hypothetical protein
MLAGRTAVRSKVRTAAIEPYQLVELDEDLQQGFVALTECFATVSGGRQRAVALAAVDLDLTDLDLLVDSGLLPAALTSTLPRDRSHQAGPPVDSLAVRKLVATVELLAGLLRQVATKSGTAEAWADLRRWRNLDPPIDRVRPPAEAPAPRMARGSEVLAEMGIGTSPARLVDISDPLVDWSRLESPAPGGTSSPDR